MTNSSNFYDENNKFGLSIFTSIAIIILSNCAFFLNIAKRVS